jgi:hypothetical protein
MEGEKMADDDVWEKAREQLVKQRHLVIEALAKGAIENNVDLLLKVQAAIDVLDVSGEEEEDDDE